MHPIASTSTKLTAGLFCLLFAVVGIAQGNTPVNITVSTINGYVADFTNVHLPSVGSADEGLGGFQVDVTSISGTNVNLVPHATFCTELGEDISAGSYTAFEIVPLQYASAGTAGRPGTPSSSIPVGGIGLEAAANLRYLFDHYYVSENLSSWTTTESQAFQLAVWEIGHDPGNFTITTSGGGVFYVPTQTGSGRTARNNAISTAQSMLNAVNAANVPINYVSTKVDIWSLADANGINSTTGYQDILFATLKSSSDGQAVVPLLPAPIPEPSTFAVVLAGTALLFRRTRRSA